MSSNERPLPRYRCHKVVWALKIKAIEIHMPTSSKLQEILDRGEGGPPGATITPVEEGYAPFEVSIEYMRKHEPQVGGYYIIYRDGYKSWSPAKEFEDGYTLI